MRPELIIGVLVAGLVLVGLVVGAFFIFRRRQSAVEQRLDQFTQAGQEAPVRAEVASDKRASPLGEAFNRALQGQGFADRIQKELAQADLKLNVGEYLSLHVILGFAGLGFGWFLGKGPLWGLLAGVGALFVPRMYVGNQKKARLVKFDNQLSDMLNLVVNGLRAGYSVTQALESVSRELPAPISSEFRRVVMEMQIGLPPDTALANLHRRIPSKDLDFVITAMNVQREVGGNLAEILDSISFTIRDRVRIKGEIETLTAQGMMTGYVISFLPIGLGLFLAASNPTYMGELWQQGDIFFYCGIGMIVAIFLMIGIGFAIIMKIVNIEV